jgi:hypothetical protein
MESLYSIPSLRMARVQCELRPEGVVSIAVEQRGNLLRGSFGDCFRRLVCDPECRGYAECPRKGSCPHELLFAPKWPAGAPLGLGTPPRGYLFRPLLDADPCFTATRPLIFELRLFGEAIKTVGMFLHAFQLLARNGIADRRMHLVTAYSLDWDGNLCAELVRDGQVTREQPRALEFASFFRDEGGPDEATIEFLTPTWLRENGRDVRVPTFSALMCRLRDRISMLCQLYERQEWLAEFAAIGHAASHATVTDWEGHWVEHSRDSTRTGEEMPLGGFLGSITCRGIDPGLWAMLRIGEEIHVGREVVWGHGRYGIRGGGASGSGGVSSDAPGNNG